MCEAEPLCDENISLKDIGRSRRGKLISRDGRGVPNGQKLGIMERWREGFHQKDKT